MPLAGQGDTVGAAIASAIAALPKGEDKAEDVWKIAATQIFAAIVANAVVTIPPGAIATTGGPASQAGPAAPVPLSIT